MALGGLTCTAATLRKVKTHTKLEVICMVRPRGSGFCYDTPELEIMFEEARALLEAGADGIAFGMLEANGTIQKEEVKKMVDLIHADGKTAVFHRAYDVSIDPYQSIETLIECGVDRLLTSGMEETAIQGMELIRQLQKRYGTKIEILPGGGINDQNIEPFLRYTGCGKSILPAGRTGLIQRQSLAGSIFPCIRRSIPWITKSSAPASCKS